MPRLRRMWGNAKVKEDVGEGQGYGGCGGMPRLRRMWGNAKVTDDVGECQG